MTEQEYIEFLDVFNKWLAGNKNEIPKRVVDKGAEKLLKAYAKEYKRLHDFLVDNLAALFEQDEVRANDTLALLKQYEERMTQLNTQISAEVGDAVMEAYVTGQLFNEVITEALDQVEVGLLALNRINTYKAEQLVADTMEDLLFSTQNTDRHIKKLVRECVAKHIQLNALKGEHSTEIAKVLRNELKRKGLSEKILKEGFVGIIDSAGRKWNLKTYVEMVIRTKMNQAYHEGLSDSMSMRDTDLARISTHNAVDHCINFEGLIISMQGKTEGYLTYAQLKATGLVFHPNCKHTCYPVNKIELLHEDYIKEHEKKLKKIKRKI